MLYRYGQYEAEIMNPHYRYMCRVIALFVLLWPLLSCAASGGPVEGIVFDKETGKPIEGAIVVARWTAQLNQIADSSTMCYHVETTTTDAEGRYRIERWHSGHPGMLQQLMMFDRDVNVTVYVDGYQMADRHAKDKMAMVPFIGTDEERLRLIAGAAVTCGAAGDSANNLLPYYEYLLNRARPFVITNTDKKILSDLQYKIEMIELSYEEASKRHTERLDTIDKE